MTIKRAREILMDATEGPWLQDKDDPNVVYGEKQQPDKAVCECFVPEARDMDARAIVLMRNTYEALLDVFEAAVSGHKQEWKLVQGQAAPSTILVCSPDCCLCKALARAEAALKEAVK